MGKQFVKMFESKSSEDLENQMNDFFHNPYFSIVSVSFFKTADTYYALVAYTNRGGI